MLALVIHQDQIVCVFILKWICHALILLRRRERLRPGASPQAQQLIRFTEWRVRLHIFILVSKVADIHTMLAARQVPAAAASVVNSGSHIGKAMWRLDEGTAPLSCQMQPGLLNHAYDSKWAGCILGDAPGQATSRNKNMIQSRDSSG